MKYKYLRDRSVEELLRLEIIEGPSMFGKPCSKLLGILAMLAKSGMVKIPGLGVVEI